MKWLLIILGAIMLFSIGCSSSGVPSPAVESYDPEVQNPQFNALGVEMECTLHENNISVIDKVCVNDTVQSSISLNSESGLWTATCCTFDMDLCHWENSTNMDNLCVNNTVARTFNTYLDDGNVRARCCNPQAKNCYMDYNIDANNDSTVCEKEYTHYPVFVNVTPEAGLWNALCCQGGYE